MSGALKNYCQQSSAHKSSTRSRGTTPGVEIAERNRLNSFRTEEIDVALWNNQELDGFHFLPYVFLVECKNWSQAVGTEEVTYLIRKCQSRGCDHGLLVAMNGIPGDPSKLTGAHFQIATALSQGTRIIVLTVEEIENLYATEELIRMVKRKL